jgi:hypothetical protein
MPKGTIFSHLGQKRSVIEFLLSPWEKSGLRHGMPVARVRGRNVCSASESVFSWIFGCAMFSFLNL